jgi:dTMP kinase
MARNGRFITFEGGEGCGKSTQIERLAARLRMAGRTVLVTREPGGTDTGEQIRHVLQYSKQSAAMVPETELLLFAASRAQLVREVILPALEAGRVVLSDRFFDSTTVYQGVARRLDAGTVEQINRFAIGEALPDLTVLIDLDPKVGLERARGRELFDRMENLSLTFHQNVRQGYLELARREPDRVRVVDGTGNLDAIEQEIWRLVSHVLR